MNEIIYFDTSALAKWYVNEQRSDDVEKYIQDHGPVAISDLTIVTMDRGLPMVNSGLFYAILET